MSQWLDEAIKKIEEQQPKERTAVWMVGEQLKDMLRAEPHLAELVVQDLDKKGMSLVECEKKIKAFADKNKDKKADFSGVGPADAEQIIQEFYGLPDRSEKPVGQGVQVKGKVLSLTDFL